jgi:hypothetical protein
MMGTFGSGLWGSGNSGSGNSGVSVQSLVMPALRIAGITKRPGITPNIDQMNEAIPALNRMLGSWNCDGHKIYTASIDAYPLTNGQKIYTIGLGGDFDNPRPLYIKDANILFPTSPVVRQPVDILDDDEWASIEIQDIPGAPPLALYYDGGLDSSGLGKIYVYFQPPDGYSLELYTWTALKTDFSAPTDVALFPPGYEHALVLNLAVHLASMYPEDSRMLPTVPGQAALAMQQVMTLNTNSPKIGTEPGMSPDYNGEAYPWLTGGIR